MKNLKQIAALAVFTMLIAVSPAAAGSHLWRFSEAFSNADGTIQFIELHESTGVDNGEIFLPGHAIASNSHNYTIGGSNLPMTTANKRLLFATPAFAALPNAPAPDYLLPPGQFFSTVLDTLTCTGWPNFAFTAGQLPTDGIHSLVCNQASCTPAQLVVAVNSPTNYAGTTAAVDASTPPPAVPDGSAGTTPMTVGKNDSAGTSLTITFDTATCSGTATREIIYGQGSQLPAALGGTFGVAGSACAIGGSPFVWSPAPDPASNLLWWIVTASDASQREGSWGKDSAGGERIGPGPGGSSGQCGIASRNVTNVCGH